MTNEFILRFTVCEGCHFVGDLLISTKSTQTNKKKNFNPFTFGTFNSLSNGGGGDKYPFMHEIFSNILRNMELIIFLIMK